MDNFNVDLIVQALVGLLAGCGVTAQVDTFIAERRKKATENKFGQVLWGLWDALAGNYRNSKNKDQ